MKPLWYRLDGHVPVPTDEPGKALDGDRTVAKTTIGQYLVSTVFLGLDHQYGDGPPLLFETMVFGEEDWVEQYMDRYATWEQAERGHEHICALVRIKLGKRPARKT